MLFTVAICFSQDTRTTSWVCGFSDIWAAGFHARSLYCAPDEVFDHDDAVEQSDGTFCSRAVFKCTAINLSENKIDVGSLYSAGYAAISCSFIREEEPKKTPNK